MPSVKDLLDVSYRSRCRHNMIPLSVKISDARGVVVRAVCTLELFPTTSLFLSRNHDMPQAGSDYLPVEARIENDTSLTVVAQYSG